MLSCVLLLGWLPALPTIIRLGRKGLPGKKTTLAYQSIKAVKSVIELAPQGILLGNVLLAIGVSGRLVAKAPAVRVKHQFTFFEGLIFKGDLQVDFP